jgi:hypothetical protein
VSLRPSKSSKGKYQHIFEENIVAETQKAKGWLSESERITKIEK